MVARDIDGSMGREINKLRREITDLLDSEEIMLQQRANVQWLGLGDKNTKFFHSKASKRKKKITILSLEGEKGNWCNTNEGIVDIVAIFSETVYHILSNLCSKSDSHNSY